MHPLPLVKPTVIGALLLLACAAQADPLLPVQNLTFQTYSGANPKDYFSSVNPANWYRGTPGPNGDLVFIDAPNTATIYGGGPNSYPVYGPFSNPPPGGNFVQADGNPDYESSFNQDISGLTVGQKYTLTFWQAASQQQSFSGATTEQWIVALGAKGSVLNVNLNGNSGTYFDTDASADIEATSVMNTPSQGVSAWEQVSVTLTATAANETLSFLAWGDGGSTVNEPPTVFLAGVNSPSLLPEPTSLALVGIAVFGLVASSRYGKRTVRSGAAPA